MDSTVIPIEGLTQAQHTLYLVINAVVMFLGPLLINWIKKNPKLNTIPTNFINAILIIVVGVIAKLVLVPDLSMEATIAVLTALFTGSTLFGRAISGSNKNK